MANQDISLLDQELQALERELGSCREPRILQGEQRVHTVIDDKKVVNLTANNYLGLATHPKIRQAASEAIEKYGVALCSGRNDIGTTDLHKELEAKIAEFQRTEAAIVLGSNSEANQAVMGSVLSETDLAIVDERSHESVIEGIRIGRASHRTYRHVDMSSLRSVLRQVKDNGYRRVLISTCGVFPMGGNIAPLPHIVELAKEYAVMTMVDDAHAMGVIGTNGRGTASHFALEGQVDIQVGGFGKAPGVVGGYIACSHKLRELIVRKANCLLHSAPPPPPVVGACIAFLELIQSDEGRTLIGKAWENAEFFRAGLKALGFHVPDYSETPLIPIMLGDADKAVRFSQRLFDMGVFVAPKGKNLRTIITAGHTRGDLRGALDAFEKVGKELAVIEG